MASLDIRWFERQSGSQWPLLMAAAAILAAAMAILLQRHVIWHRPVRHRRSVTTSTDPLTIGTV